MGSNPIIPTVVPMALSDKGLVHQPFKLDMLGSSPTGVTIVLFVFHWGVVQWQNRSL